MRGPQSVLQARDRVKITSHQNGVRRRPRKWGQTSEVAEVVAEVGSNK